MKSSRVCYFSIYLVIYLTIEHTGILLEHGRSTEERGIEFGLSALNLRACPCSCERKSRVKSRVEGYSSTQII